MDHFKNILIYIIFSFLPFLLIIMILRFTSGLSAEFLFKDFWEVLSTFPYAANLDDLLTCFRRIISTINNVTDILTGATDFSLLGIIRSSWSLVHSLLLTTINVIMLPFNTIFYILEWIINVVRLFLSQ